MTTAPPLPLPEPEPDDIVVSVMAGIEPGLTEEVVRQAIADAAASRAKRRRLARALTDDADLLTSGRPEGPAVIGDFIRALLAHGSCRAVLPKCPECGSTKKLPSLRADGKRICQPCDHKDRAASLSCIECSRPARIYRRTRTGEAICRDCWRLPDGDPIALISAAITAVAPDADPAAVRRAVESVAPVGNVYLMFRLLWEIEDTPGLLTGEGAKGSARAARLITALAAAGVCVTAPACHGCGEVRPLTNVLDNRRCCLTCYRKANSAACGRCGRDRAIATRRPDGTPLCSPCMRHEADQLITCVLCDRVRPVGRRTKDGPLCGACYRPVLLTCSFCGKGPRRCYRAATGMPRCDTCSRTRRTCVGCGKDKYAAARTEEGHLCETCWQKNPISFNPCRLCGTVEYLHSYGRCHSCVRDQQVRDALSRDGAMHPSLQPVHDVLVAGGAKAGLSWLERPSARTILDALADGTCPLTHEGLDALLPNKSVAFLRAALVAAGVLPARDERFAALERWIASATEAVPDDGERKLVRRFATWHHLRRLRRESAKHPVTSTQATAVRASIRAAVALLVWLREQGTELELCTKVHLDEWIDSGSTTRYDARGFVEWCRKNRHIGKDLEIPAREKLSHVRPTDEDERWAVSRRLMHDDALAIEDRFAGLLVLLYAQPLTVVSQLPVTAVIIEDQQTSLMLGDSPLLLPDPLNRLARRLVARRRGHTTIGTSADSPWLFPGAFVGQPLSSHHLGKRLKRLGIYSRPGRTSALMGLSTQLPAAVLTELLGISPETATAWTQSGGNWARYAAELIDRPHPRA
ncbi:hypothetical protein OOK48_24160 [Streptomyces viridodiastaticus]|uniref:hypothetical protein n=1 Tax=Streptomyces albogriseolus TaxID=1887 RepID=UPI002255FF48|nr:hypothetical protein [Streptomyces viridodiastaticus]MCX4569433.1 hypothetical protein [Streptomyces viridodiastaticus]